MSAPSNVRPTPGGDFNVVFIGAGNIMFGSDEGPWNHSIRFERKLGSRLKIVALVDPSLDRSASVLEIKRKTPVASAYNDTLTYPNIDDFVQNMKPEQAPHAIVIGCPPAYRGSNEPGRDLELKLLKYFPGVALFVEKPVATGLAPKAFDVANNINEATIVCSVGYMLRYLAAVQKMKQIIAENNLTVMATTARYGCAYESIAKYNWWNKDIDCGPVVEQGTHFCDLSRYFGGDVDVSSVLAHSVEHYEAPGKLSKIPIDESKIAPEQRIPRATTATWKYANGAVGMLLHAVALHDTNYSCEFEVYCDGYQLRLIDPYNNPTLYVRRPGNNLDEVHTFPEDDPFYSEVSNFIDVIEQGPQASTILSSFEDACKSYEFSWAIRHASEATRKVPA